MSKFTLIIMTHQERRLDSEEAHEEALEFINSIGIDKDNRIVVTEGGISKPVHHHVFCRTEDAERIMSAWNANDIGTFRSSIGNPVDEDNLEIALRYLTRTCPEKREEYRQIILKMCHDLSTELGSTIKVEDVLKLEEQKLELTKSLKNNGAKKPNTIADKLIKHSEITIMALKKLIPKPMKKDILYTCPVCDAYQNTDEDTDVSCINYCWRCGNALELPESEQIMLPDLE